MEVPILVSLPDFDRTDVQDRFKGSYCGTRSTGAQHHQGQYVRFQISLMAMITGWNPIAGDLKV